MYRIFGQFTMETILATAFGCQVNILKGEGNSLTEAAAGIFSDSKSSSVSFSEILCCTYVGINTILVICYSSSNSFLGKNFWPPLCKEI